MLANIDPGDTAAAAAYYKASRTDGTWTSDKAEALLRVMKDPGALLVAMAGIDKELAVGEPEERRHMCREIVEIARAARDVASGLQARFDSDEDPSYDQVSMVIHHLERAAQIIGDVEQVLGGAGGPSGGGVPSQAEAKPSPPPSSSDRTEAVRRAVLQRRPTTPDGG